MIKAPVPEADFSPIRRLKWITWGIVACWTGLVVWSLYSQMVQHRNEVEVLARAAAKMSFKKDRLYWELLPPEGFYVSVTDQTQPNPLLAHVPERDITTPSGRKLTLLHPAEFIRRVYVAGQKEKDAWGHLTSRRPLRPENAPDPWEAEALRAIEAGRGTVYSTETIDGEVFVRTMHALETKQPCLQCHVAQGYQVGRFDSGISVSVPWRHFEGVALKRVSPTGMAHLLLWGAGTVSCLVGSRRLQRDMRTRIQTEANLRKSENRFRLAMEATNESLWEWDILTDRIYHSPHFASALGYADEQTPDRLANWFELLHPEDREQAMRSAERLARDPDYTVAVEHRLKTKAGQWRWFRTQGKVVEQNADGRPMRAVGTHLDITDRKHIEVELQESREAVLGLLDAATDSMFLLDVELHVVACNEVGARRLGHAPDEIVGHSLLDLYSPDAARRYKAKVDEMLVARQPLRFVDEQDGRAFDHHLIPVTDQTGRVYRMALFAWDITEQRQAEQTLRRTLAFNEALLEAVNSLVIVLDAEGRIVRFNRACEHLTGWKAEEVIGREMWRCLIPAEQIEGVRAVFAQLATGRFTTYHENEWLTRDGGRRHITWASAALTDAGGSVEYIVGTGIDVTDRKRAEEALRTSETKFRDIVETTREWIWEMDTRGMQIYSNRTIERILGYTPTEIVGRPFWDLMVEEDRIEAERRMPEYIHEKHGWTGRVMRWRHKDGSMRWLESNAIALFDAMGRLIGFRGADRDITERKQAEDALRAIVEGTASAIGAQYYRNLVRQLAAALEVRYALVAEITDTAHNRVRTLAFWAGNDWGENFEYSLEGTPCASAVQQGLCSYPRDVRAQFPADRQLAELNIEGYIGTPLRDDSGNVVGLVAVMDTKPLEREELAASMLQIFSARAATEIARQRSELERVRLEGKLRHAQKMEAIGTLAAGIAHDFNNLLTAISGYTDLAKSQLAPDHPSRQALEILDGAVRDAGGIANSLLTFSRKTATAKSPVRFCTVVRDSTRLFRRLLPASIRVIEEYSCDEDLHVYADVGQLHQVLMNLVTNARDAMPSGGQIRIAVSAEASEEPVRTDQAAGSPAVLLAVEDDGAGMAPEIAAKIFDPFFTTKPRGKGTGLGLAMVHGIIQDHGGRIEIQTEPGKGTRITIRLPSCPAPKEGKRALSPKSPREPRGRTILLAEDNDFVRSMITQTLKGKKHHVVAVANGDDALSRMRDTSEPFDLLVLDVDLPGKSGLQCFDEVRATHPTLPILLITGSPGVEARDEDEYSILLRKPFRMAELAFVANRLLAGPQTEET